MLVTPTRQIQRPTELIPAIGYIRVSSWFEEKISDELQKIAIEEATRRRGRIVVAWIVDLDATGRNFKRKIMEAIGTVEASDSHGPREIWVWKYSRFGRNRHGIAINLARVEHAGGQLISATEEIDATTATGRFTRGMLFELAAFESDRIGEQWRETHDYRRAHGLPATGRQRFGYLWHQREVVDGILRSPERYDPDPATADIVRQMYEDYAHNAATLKDLVERLNDGGLLNPGGRADDGWSRQSVAYYLDCGFPAGLLHVHRSDISCPMRGKCKPDSDHYSFIPGAQPQIIDDDLWAGYRERRKQRRTLPPRARIPRYPYSGLTRCGLCGAGASACSGAKNEPGYVFRCTTRYSQQRRNVCRGSIVTGKRVEAEVKAWLGTAAAEVDRRLHGSVVIPSEPKPHSANKRRERLGAELAKLQRGLDRALDAYAMGDINREEHLGTKKRLEEKRDVLAAELAELNKEDDPKAPATWEVRGAVIGRLLDEWDTLPVSGKRDLLQVALKEIRLFPAGSDPRVVCVPREGFVF